MNLCDLKVNLCGQKKLKGAELAAHTVNSEPAPKLAFLLELPNL